MSVDLEDEFHKKMDKIMKREAIRGNLGLRVYRISARMTLVDRANQSLDSHDSKSDGLVQA